MHRWIVNRELVQQPCNNPAFNCISKDLHFAEMHVFGFSEDVPALPISSCSYTTFTLHLHCFNTAFTLLFKRRYDKLYYAENLLDC